MPILQFPSQLFTSGRACAGPLAVVLHEWSGGIETLDLAMGRCPRPKPAQSPGCHTSFHYGISGSVIHQYVQIADTSWGFGLTPPGCPEPLCDPTACESCAGLLVAEFNPDVDGNPPVLPGGWGVAGPDGTANCRALHVAVQNGSAQAGSQIGCCGFFQQNTELDQSYRLFVHNLALVFIAAGLTPTQSTLLVHCGELDCLDIDQLVTDVVAAIAAINTPAVLPPCQCVSDSFQLQSAVRADNANIVTNDSNVFLYEAAGAGDWTLVDPAAGDAIRRDIWIKNLSADDLTLHSAALIDGVAAITLNGTIPAGYPYGNNGGDAVHLLWTGSTWLVL